MKEGRPFEADIPANLKKLAWTVFVIGAVTQIAEIAERIILANAYHFKTRPCNGGSQNITKCAF